PTVSGRRTGRRARRVDRWELWWSSLVLQSRPEADDRGDRAGNRGNAERSPGDHSVHDADVLRLGALRTGGQIKLHLVVLLQVPVAGTGNRAEVDEDVRAGFRGDEAEALLTVEPLDGAHCHGTYLPSWPGSDHRSVGQRRSAAEGVARNQGTNQNPHRAWYQRPGPRPPTAGHSGRGAARPDPHRGPGVYRGDVLEGTPRVRSWDQPVLLPPPSSPIERSRPWTAGPSPTRASSTKWPVSARSAAPPAGASWSAAPPRSPSATWRTRRRPPPRASTPRPSPDSSTTAAIAPPRSRTSSDASASPAPRMPPTTTPSNPSPIPGAVTSVSGPWRSSRPCCSRTEASPTG